MFKRFLVAFFILVACSQAFAAVYLVEPFDQKLSPGQELSFGKAARGETLRVVIKKKSDLAMDWASFSVDPDFLPLAWKAETVESDKTLILELSIAGNATVSTQRLKFIASNGQQELSEPFFASVSVHENLLNASIEDLDQEAALGRKTLFNLVLNNDSAAAHSVRIESTLPAFWFEGFELTLLPHETKAVPLEVLPLSYGEKNFSISVYSLHNRASFEFPATLNVRPTLLGMYQAPVTGLPVFSPAMLPYFLINGLLSIFR